MTRGRHGQELDESVCELHQLIGLEIQILPLSPASLSREQPGDLPGRLAVRKSFRRIDLVGHRAHWSRPFAWTRDFNSVACATTWTRNPAGFLPLGRQGRGYVHSET